MEHLLNDIIELIGNNMPTSAQWMKTTASLKCSTTAGIPIPSSFPLCSSTLRRHPGKASEDCRKRDSAPSVSVSASTAMTTPTTTPALLGRFSPGRKKEESCTGSCKVIASAAVQLS